MPDKLCIISCVMFQKELTKCVAECAFTDVVTASFPADCGRPPLQQSKLEKCIKQAQTCDKTVVIGSCCIQQLSKQETTIADVRFVNNAQCFYLFVDKPIIDHWVQQGSYLITPGWLINWEKHLKTQGFNQQNAAEFYNSCANKLVFLDTGVESDMVAALQEFSAYVDLPCERIAIGLDYLKLYLSNIVLEWRIEQEKSRIEKIQQQQQAEVARYEMTMDLVNQLARAMKEQEATDAIITMLTMLFGAEHVDYLKEDSESLQQHCQISRISSDNNYCWSESGQGFFLRVASEQRNFGWLLVEQLAFPQYKENYLNLGLTLARVFSLALENAYTYQQLQNTITELKQTQSQLVEAEKMASLGRLVAGVAHEINTPLGVSIIANTSLIQRSKQISSLFESRDMKHSDLTQYLHTAQEAAGLIQNNLQRINELIKSFKQISIDQYTDKAHDFNVKAYIYDVIYSLGKKLDKSSVRIEVICDKDLQIHSYPGAFSQILINFLQNSIIHGFKNKTKGTIEITAALADHQLQVDYRDDGNGIDQAILPKIFDPFVTSNRQQGTGLGLNIVYNLVTQKLGGEISCDSVYGQGVHFQFMVPLDSQTIDVP